MRTTTADARVAFNDGDLLSFLGRLHGRAFATRSRSNYDHVILAGFHRRYLPT